MANKNQRFPRGGARNPGNQNMVSARNIDQYGNPAPVKQTPDNTPGGGLTSAADWAAKFPNPPGQPTGRGVSPLADFDNSTVTASPAELAERAARARLTPGAAGSPYYGPPAPASAPAPRPVWAGPSTVYRPGPPANPTVSGGSLDAGPRGSGPGGRPMNPAEDAAALKANMALYAPHDAQQPGPVDNTPGAGNNAPFRGSTPQEIADFYAGKPEASAPAATPNDWQSRLKHDYPEIGKEKTAENAAFVKAFKGLPAAQQNEQGARGVASDIYDQKNAAGEYADSDQLFATPDAKTANATTPTPATTSNPAPTKPAALASSSGSVARDAGAAIADAPAVVGSAIDSAKQAVTNNVTQPVSDAVSNASDSSADSDASSSRPPWANSPGSSQASLTASATPPMGAATDDEDDLWKKMRGGPGRSGADSGDVPGQSYQSP